MPPLSVWAFTPLGNFAVCRATPWGTCLVNKANTCTCSLRALMRDGVVPDRVAKSISHETTFARDIDDDEVLAAWLHELADQVGRRLRACQLFGETVHLKLRFRDFRTVTRSQKLQNPTNVSQEIADTVTTLFRERIQQNRLPVRLVGVGVSQLNQGGLRQKLLFDEAAHDAERKLDATRDKIAAKFGQTALVRGAKLLHRNDRGKPPDESR